VTLPNDGPSGSEPERAELRVRELGLRFIMRLAALIRIGKAYQVGNQVFTRQIQGFHEAALALLADFEEVVLASLDTDLYVNGFRIPIRAANLKFHEAVLAEFKRRKIAGIKLERGVERQEIENFFAFFMQPDVYHGTSLLEVCLAAGIDGILPAIHASTEAPEGRFFEGEPGFEEEASHDDGAAWSREAESAPETEARVPKGAARKSYRIAMLGMRSLLATTSISQGMELRHAKRVVQPLVDGAFADEPVVVGLTSLGHHDEFTYAHSVNVCMVAVTMGHYLGLDRRALADLGVAALLHDVGKNAVAHLIQRPFDEFTDEERVAAERHPVEGAKLLARSTTLNATTLRCIRVALEHHIYPAGEGYPTPPRGWTTSLLSRVVAVADCYVCLLTYRSRHGGNVTPYQALGMMLGPMRASFDPVMLWALVQSVGLYPPGQVVQLDDGCLAIVLSPNPDDLERPHVKVIARADRRRLTAEEAVEHRPLPPGLSISRALRSEEYPEGPQAVEAA
jgi:HD-GYP domain-containing protein (c-di-GMP phosphodiesterase class II)